MVVEAAETAPSLPYHEPAIVTILVTSSFLLILNITNAVLDHLVYCGLLGQVLVGIAWGTPGAKWLSTSVEEVMVQLGYLGLILLVYEGGLSTSFKSLKANLLLSSAVAITGIAAPIGLSYTLQGLLNATPLQAFAAGAALCSTSLGTTFTVLASSGLSSSRLGVVLTSAAMMDDVVGLVMVQVISNLGGAHFSAVTVVRPVVVSIAFAVVVPLACYFLVKPLTVTLNHYRTANPDNWITEILRRRQTAFTVHTALLLTLVTGASYAGTTINWWDSEVPHPVNETQDVKKSIAKENACTTGAAQSAAGEESRNEIQVQQHGRQASEPEEEPTVHSQANPTTANATSGSAIYEQYYQQAVARILQPLFFASIGFSIPITRMFEGPIVWRGIIYTVLMSLAKLVCGLWLVRLSLAPVRNALRGLLSKLKLPSMPHLWGRSNQTSDARPTPRSPQNDTQITPQHSATYSAASNSHTSPAPKPLSLQPSLILAFAMTARGEIGFLISAVAESNGIFSSPGAGPSSESDIFLVVTWAIVLCTILGPLGVGLSVRRVKKLEERKNRAQEGTGRDVLGVWGVE